MLDKAEWAHLIPHAGAMCLLDAVAAWDATAIHAVSRVHRDTAHPLRAHGRLHAIHLAEYGAQAGAVHGALRARAAGDETIRPGVLVTLRDVCLHAQRIDDLEGELDVHAACLLADAHGAQYRFVIEHRGTRLVEGRCAVIHPHE
jgi:predicted hotdog family 3-hydroxylacyl-ACP dehydratase